MNPINGACPTPGTFTGSKPAPQNQGHEPQGFLPKLIKDGVEITGDALHEMGSKFHNAHCPLFAGLANSFADLLEHPADCIEGVLKNPGSALQSLVKG